MINIIKGNINPNTFIRCSSTDLITLGLPMALAFFYDYQIDKETIKKGLTKSIDKFPLFAGTLKTVSNNQVIHANNKGIVTNFEQYEITSKEAVKSLFNARTPIDLFDPNNANSPRSNSLFSVTVSYFNDNTMSIAFFWNYVLGDTKSIMHFIRDLSRNISGKKTDSPLIIPHRHNYITDHIKNNLKTNPTVRIVNKKAIENINNYLNKSAKSKKRLYFYFDKNELDNLSLFYTNNIGLSNKFILSAHMFSCICENDPEKRRGRYLSFTVDYRDFYDIPDNAIGNFLDHIRIYTNNNEQKKPGSIAEQLHRDHLYFSEYSTSYYANTKFLEDNGGTKSLLKYVSMSLEPLNGTVDITDWSDLDFYDIDFGIKKPYFVSPKNVTPFPWISNIFEGFNGNGLIFSTVLPNSVTKNILNIETIKKIHFCKKNKNPDFIKKYPDIY